MLGRIICSIVAFLVVLPLNASAQAPGRYIGTVQAQWDDGGRTMTLLQPFEYEDPKGNRWVAPKGSVIDGASIPRFAWSFIGGPFEGLYRNASVIHDVACVQRTKPWNLVHETFYLGMLTSGVDATKAKVMYAAVYHFGPRWVTRNADGTISGASDTPPPQTLSRADFDVLKAEIESRDKRGQDISLREIRSFSR